MAIDLPTARKLSTDVVAVVKMLQHLRNHAPRIHPDVEPTSLPLLFTVAHRPTRLSDLAASVHSDASVVSRQVTHLAALGLIRKTPDPDDRRAVLIDLTDEGAALVAHHIEVRGAWLRELLADWTPAEAADFDRHLRRFLTSIRTAVDRPPAPPPATAVTTPAARG